MSFLNSYTLIFNYELKKSTFLKVFIFSIIGIFFLSFVLTRTDFGISENGLIKKYQLSKINKDSFLDTKNIIVGDSSAGNAINSKYFSQLSKQKTANLSLNGSWGIAGSLGILKKAYNKNNKIKNVLIIQTLDIWTRGYPYEAIFKLYTFNEIIKEVGLYKFITYSFNPKVFWWNFKNILKLAIGYKPIISLSNDYIQQEEIKYSNNMKTLNKNISLTGRSLNKDKLKEILSLEDYCNQKKLNCIFAHGPIHKVISNNSMSYIKEINNTLEKNLKIKFIKDVFSYKNEFIGDSLDHIDVIYKDKVTEDYYNKLKDLLID